MEVIKMDYQQERLHFKIGYILGLIDGEGCYQLGHDGRGHYYPQLIITNTDQLIIETAYKYLKELNIPCWIWSPKKYGKEKRQGMRLYIKGIRRMKRFLDLFFKYPHAKKERAFLIKQYCERRLAIPLKELYLNGKHDNSIEIEIRRKLTDLNKKNKGAISSETIRLTSHDEDIVRPQAKA